MVDGGLRCRTCRGSRAASARHRRKPRHPPLIPGRPCLALSSFTSASICSVLSLIFASSSGLAVIGGGAGAALRGACAPMVTAANSASAAMRRSRFMRMPSRWNVLTLSLPGPPALWSRRGARARCAGSPDGAGRGEFRQRRQHEAPLEPCAGAGSPAWPSGPPRCRRAGCRCRSCAALWAQCACRPSSRSMRPVRGEQLHREQRGLGLHHLVQEPGLVRDSPPARSRRCGDARSTRTSGDARRSTAVRRLRLAVPEVRAEAEVDGLHRFRTAPAARRSELALDLEVVVGQSRWRPGRAACG